MTTAQRKTFKEIMMDYEDKSYDQIIGEDSIDEDLEELAIIIPG